MTTPQAITGTPMEQWEPYPELEKEEKEYEHPEQRAARLEEEIRRLRGI